MDVSDVINSSGVQGMEQANAEQIPQELDDLLGSIRSDDSPPPKKKGRKKKEPPARDFKTVL